MSTLALSVADAISSTNPRVIDDARARKLSNDLKRCTYYETCATYGLNVERVFQDGKCPAWGRPGPGTHRLPLWKSRQLHMAAGTEAHRAVWRRQCCGMGQLLVPLSELCLEEEGTLWNSPRWHVCVTLQPALHRYTAPKSSAAPPYADSCL